MAADPARDRLLAAALTFFLERGVFATPVQEICSEAGVGVGSLYHHFGDKEGIAGELFAASLESFQSAFVEAVTARDDAETGIRAGVKSLLAWSLDHHPEEARFLLFHGDAARGSAPERLEEQNRGFYRAVLGWWRPHVRYGALRDLDVDLAYSLWLGPGQQYCRLRLAGRSDISINEANQVLSQGAWDALREFPDEGG